MMTLLLFPAKKKLQPLPEHKHTRLGISRIQEKVSIQETEICPSVLNGLSSPLFHSSTPTAKSIHTKKANQTIHSPPPMGRLMTRALKQKMAHFPLLHLSLFYFGARHRECNIPFNSSSHVAGCVPSQPLHTLQSGY